jgi:vancomycin permeability regulator SanA
MVKSQTVLGKIIKMLIIIISVAIILSIAITIIPRVITSLYAWPRTYSTEDAPPKKVAIVFGAGLWRDGSPTPVLRDRVETAGNLYFGGKVDKLLMSGDNSSIYYNEPGAMREYALELGIPEEDIVLDYAGQRTYDTCYRAKLIFDVNEAILVTQPFHLPRALYTCNKLGVEAFGVPAKGRIYRRISLAFWNIREVPATLFALWQVHFTRPLPILGKPEPIYPLEVQ